MKKIFSLILAIAMMAALSVTAFAANPIVSANGNDSAPVNGTYVEGSKTDVYKVDITWGAMNFTYTASAQTWDDVNHVWTDGESGTWTATGNTVVLANHSSAAVTATFAFAAEGDYALTGTFSGVTENKATLAIPEANGAATTCTATLTIEGKLPSTHVDGAKIGTVTVTLG